MEVVIPTLPIQWTRQTYVGGILITKITLFADPCSAPLLGASHSGAPGEVSCTSCHSGSTNTGPGTINYLIGDSINNLANFVIMITKFVDITSGLEYTVLKM